MKRSIAVHNVPKCSLTLEIILEWLLICHFNDLPVQIIRKESFESLKPFQNVLERLRMFIGEPFSQFACLNM